MRTCTFEGVAADTEFTIVALNAAGGSTPMQVAGALAVGTLPSTGTDAPARIAHHALLALLAGALLVVVSRRGRRAELA